jgi:hypothetical protein
MMRHYTLRFLFLFLVFTSLSGQMPACAPDGDGDGTVDPKDNCKDVYNPYQTDTDGNGIGDACDILKSCKEIRDLRKDVKPLPTDGIYDIDPDGPSGSIAPFKVYCDMTSNGGGWTRVLNGVQVTDWTTVRVNQSVVLSGTSDQGSNSAANGWVGLALWSKLGNIMRMRCTGGYTGSQDGYGNFSLDDKNNYAIQWAGMSGNWNSWHNGRQLSTLDYDRDLWSSQCVSYGGHESSGWGWHYSCHIGSAWIGSNGKNFCQVYTGCTYSGAGCETDHVEWFVRDGY